MRRIITSLIIIGFLVAIAGLFFTRPQTLPGSAFLNLPPVDLTNGERLFNIGGCASCHAAPGAKGDAKRLLSGGLPIESDFGTFFVPNISPDPDAGIGSWDLEDFANAMIKGTSPGGEHYYPAFPYTSYSRITMKDASDLFGFMKTLPPSTKKAPAHDVGFPFNIRLALGGWKLLYYNAEKIAEPIVQNAEIERGQYLVEALGHCGECHTPRNQIGGLQTAKWLSGAQNPDGPGIIPNITPGDEKFSKWSEVEIFDYLKTGFTPDFDSVGGSMVSVQENLSKLPDEDIQAIVAYLKALPSLPDGHK